MPEFEPHDNLKLRIPDLEDFDLTPVSRSGEGW
jgi:hypothetical protein